MSNQGGEAMRKTVTAVVLLTASLSYAGTVPTKGVFCWNPNKESDLAGYNLYTKDPGGAQLTVNVGKPGPIAGCPSGKIGVLRDMTGKPQGQWEATVNAYDTAGNKSGWAAPVTFTVDPAIDPGVPPGVPSGFDVE
jgi:hypothetical protein